MGNSNSQDTEAEQKKLQSEQQSSTGYVDLRTPPNPFSESEKEETKSVVSASAGASTSGEKDAEEISGEKRFDTVMRVVIHSINDIIRETDVGSDIDPFVEVRANQFLLGATKPKTDMTSCRVDESFYIKTLRDPSTIKLKFYLKDQDHMTDDDLIGHGYFDLAEEDNTMNQTVHLKWKGKEIGTINISVDFQNLVVM